MEARAEYDLMWDRNEGRSEDDSHVEKERPETDRGGKEVLDRGKPY